MTDARASRIHAEVLLAPATVAAQASRIHAEVLLAPATVAAQVSRIHAEVLTDYVPPITGEWFSG